MRPIYVSLIATVCAAGFAVLSLIAMENREYFLSDVFSFLFGVSSAAVMAVAVFELINKKKGE